MTAGRRKGIAAVTALLLLVVVAGVTAIMLSRMLGEVRNTADDGGIVQSLLLARGTANLAGAVLQGPARAALQEIVEVESSTTSRWSFGTGAVGADRPDPDSVARVLTNDADSVAVQFQEAIDALVCDAALPDVGEGRSTRLRIYVTESACGEGLPGDVRVSDGRFVGGAPRDGSGSAADQNYSLPYVIVAEGVTGPYRRSLVLQGEYQFRVGRGSFAQYALFTNVHSTPRGSDIWFTERTLFDGPVHTNERFRFYRTPWFGGRVTSAGCVAAGATGCENVWGSDVRPGAEFYGEGFVDVGDMQPPTAPSETNRYGRHAPELAGGVDWSAAFVPLPENAQDQEQAARDEGLFIDDDVAGLRMYAGYENGSVATAGDATHQYLEATSAGWQRVCDASGCRWEYEPTTRYRFDASGTLKRESCIGGVCTWENEGPFNGVIYVDGNVDRVRGPERSPAWSTDGADARPAIASFAQMTLATSRSVRVTGDIAYENPPCSSSPTRGADGTVDPADCSNLDARNIFGVYSQGGDVFIGNNNRDSAYNAPENVVIHGVLMSSTGVVQVEDYNRGLPRGTVELIGGIIENAYGAFGTFNASTGRNSTGYGRSFTFDRRTAAGLAPPYFPTIGQDGVKNVLVFSYGQREQVF